MILKGRYWLIRLWRNLRYPKFYWPMAWYCFRTRNCETVEITGHDPATLTYFSRPYPPCGCRWLVDCKCDGFWWVG